MWSDIYIENRYQPAVFAGDSTESDTPLQEVDGNYSFSDILNDADGGDKEDTEMEVHVPIGTVKESTEWLSRAVSIFNKPGLSESEKIKILTLAPPSWSVCLIRKYFNCSEHLVRKSKGMIQDGNILSSPAPRAGLILSERIIV